MVDKVTKIYKLRIKTIDGNIISIIVDKYDITDGFVCFFDPKYKTNKLIPVSNVEIEVLNESI